METFDEIVEAIDGMESDRRRHMSIQIEEALHDAIGATSLSGGSATITIEVKVRRDQGRRVVFSADVRSKLPRPSLCSATLFADDDGSIHKQDPAQFKLPLGRTPILPDDDESEH